MTPHRLDPEDVLEDLRTPWGWKEYASATTADRSQRKYLEIAIGSERFRVSRRYLSELDPEILIVTESLSQAVRAYNLLS